MRELKFRAYSKKFKGMIYESKIFHIDVTANTVWKDLCSDESPVLMQYTGLKDKNGKEIYEGDILNYEPFSPAQVVWKDNGFLIDICGLLYQIWEDSEVIGNIYENPEILK